MELTPTTPALPKNIHMSYEYELIVCQSDKEAIENFKKVRSKHFLSISGRGGGQSDSLYKTGWLLEGQLFDLFRSSFLIWTGSLNT
jgi:hypothetical protein